MGHVHAMTQVGCPIDAAFEFGANPERVAEWVTMTAEVRDSELLHTVGAGYTSVLKIAGRKLETKWRVSDVDRPRLMRLRGVTPGGGTATFEMRYAPVADGTEVTVDGQFELPGGIFGELADRILVERSVEREIERSMDRFKAIVERESAVHV